MPSLAFATRLSARLAALALLACLTLVAASAAAAPATPAGPAFTLSGEDGFFLAPDVAVDAAGNAVATWYGEAPDQAVPDVEIYARRYAPSGLPLGPTFTVNAVADGQQRRPAVAVHPDGAFVVAWDTDTRTIWARRFTADGRPTGGDIAVSQRAATHRDPDVAIAADGSFVVVWELTAAGDDDIAIRRFDAEGAPLGDERLLSDPAPDTARQLNPALAALPGGALAIVWERQSGTLSAPLTAVELLRLDAAGSPLGALQPVATSAAEELRDPAASAGPTGELVVAWSSFTTLGSQIFARSFGPDGAPKRPPVAVSPAEPAQRTLPAAASATDGAAIVTWTDSAPQAGAPAGVAARLLDGAGDPVAEPFYPRPPALGYGGASSVATALSAGSPNPLWLTWAQSPPVDGEVRSAVYARRLVERLYSTSLPLVRR